MKKERLCFLCLEKEHLKSECTADIKCGKCSEKHATCLHRKSNKVNLGNSNELKENTTPSESVISHKIHTSSIAERITTMTIPVYISSPEDPSREILTYALIDSQSDQSYILQEVCDSLFISRVRKKLKVSTITSRGQVQWCDRIANLQVRGFTSPKTDTITVDELYSLDSIPANKEHIPTPKTAESWPHLQSVKDKLVPLQACEVGLIIGFSCSAASLPLETVKQNLALPYAVKTILGWLIIGGRDPSESLSVVHRIHSHDVTTDQVLKRIEGDLVVRHSEPRRSQNDLRFLKIMDSNISQDSKGFYTMPLPFKQKPCMPNNRSYALRRLKGLESRFNASPELLSKYKAFMNEIIERGEAEKVKDRRKWMVHSTPWRLPSSQAW